MHVMQAFMTLIRNKDTEEYIESLLGCFAAPTIRGLKAGSLINLRRFGDDRIAETWSVKKTELLRKFRVEALEITSRSSEEGNTVLLLLYKRDLLNRALFDEAAWAILAPLGYGQCHSCVDAYLEHLKKRFENDFPHEIGIFLGYPPEDVAGFIRYRGERSLAAGYWKVYGNVRQAQKTFKRFKRAEHLAAKEMIRRSTFSARMHKAPV